MDTIDESKRRRRHFASAVLSDEDKRKHCVSTRLNVHELAQLDELRSQVQMERGEYLRTAALHKLPPTIPAINRDAWSSLASTTANLNQIARALNMGGDVEMEAVRAELKSLRLKLIDVGGVFHESESDTR